jgi:RecA-family ATPase
MLGGISPAQGDVLYCALEDNVRRLQKRIQRLCPLATPWPAGLTLVTQWRRLDKGGVDDIVDWIKSVPAPRLVVLDTLAGVKPVRSNASYADDYDALGTIQRLANELGLAVLVLHHTRKLEANDPIDTVSGTLGLSGCADTIMVLNRGASGTTLYGRGRDTEEFERAVEFVKETCQWRLLGDAADVRRSDTRKAILAAMQDAPSTTPKEIAAALNVEANVVHQRLRQMTLDGEVAKTARGHYRLPGMTDVP